MTVLTRNCKPHKFVLHLQDKGTLYFHASNSSCVVGYKTDGCKKAVGDYSASVLWATRMRDNSEKIKRSLTLVMLDLIPAFEECQKYCQTEKAE